MKETPHHLGRYRRLADAQNGTSASDLGMGGTALSAALETMHAHDIHTASEALDYLADDRSHGDEYAAAVALELIHSNITRWWPVAVDYRISVAFMVAYIQAEADRMRDADEAYPYTADEVQA